MLFTAVVIRASYKSVIFILLFILIFKSFNNLSVNARLPSAAQLVTFLSFSSLYGSSLPSRFIIICFLPSVSITILHL